MRCVCRLFWLIISSRFGIDASLSPHIVIVKAVGYVFLFSLFFLSWIHRWSVVVTQCVRVCLCVIHGVMLAHTTRLQQQKPSLPVTTTDRRWLHFSEIAHNSGCWGCWRGSAAPLRRSSRFYTHHLLCGVIERSQSRGCYATTIWW